MTPYKNAQPITPDDDADLIIGSSRGIIAFITEGGFYNLAFHDENGDAVTLSNLLSGVLYPIETKRIMATNTTATSVTVLW